MLYQDRNKELTDWIKHYLALPVYIMDEALGFPSTHPCYWAAVLLALTQAVREEGAEPVSVIAWHDIDLREGLPKQTFILWGEPDPRIYYCDTEGQLMRLSNNVFEAVLTWTVTEETRLVSLTRQYLIRDLPPPTEQTDPYLNVCLPTQ